MNLENVNLSAYYNALYEDSIQKIRSNSYHTDDLIDSSKDNRLGLTLLARPDKKVKIEIQKCLDHIKLIEPQQYYYPETDLHITVMSLISCYSGFELSQISIEDYINIIEKSLCGLNNFDVYFKGLTLTKSCLMVQGFVDNSVLSQIRSNLRKNFKRSKLEQSIDKRYRIQTAHTTILRFKKELQDREAFLKKVEEYRDHDFGTFRVTNLDFVFNDWYQRKDHVKTLHKFELK